MYTPTAWYFSRVVISMCSFFFYPFLLTCCSIWFYGLQVMGLKGFCEWWGIITLLAFVGSSFGMCMGGLFPLHNKAQMVAQLFITVFTMGAGFLTNTSDSASLLITFLSYISPLHYACELLLGRILQGRN